jgi:hypothetical protein
MFRRARSRVDHVRLPLCWLGGRPHRQSRQGGVASTYADLDTPTIRPALVPRARLEDVSQPVVVDPAMTMTPAPAFAVMEASLAGSTPTRPRPSDGTEVTQNPSRRLRCERRAGGNWFG